MKKQYQNDAARLADERRLADQDFHDMLARRDHIAAHIKKIVSGKGRSIDENTLRREMRQLVGQAKLPRDRRCPRCQRVVIEKRKWFQSKICMSCHRAHEYHSGDSEAREFATPAYGYCIEFESDLTNLDLGIELGMSSSKVYRFRRGRMCRQEDMEAIRDCVEVHSFEILDRELIGYLIDGQALKETRLAYGIGLRAFATRCGWGNSKLNSYERHHRDGARCVNLEDSEKLLRAMHFYASL